MVTKKFGKRNRLKWHGNKHSARPHNEMFGSVIVQLLPYDTVTWEDLKGIAVKGSRLGEIVGNLG